MKKKRLISLVSVFVVLIFVLIVFYKWNTNIYMELTRDYPNKIDLQIKIDNNIVFDDSLGVHPLLLPEHITHPIKIGYHDIEIISKDAKLCNEVKLYLFFNQYIKIDIYKKDNSFFISTGNNPFWYE